MSWLASPERFLKPSKARFVFFLVGAAAFVVTEFGRFVCRPYIRSHGINDLGFTESIGNSGGIIVMIFLGCAVLNPTRTQSFRLAAFYSIGFVVYEFVQPFLPKGVFDWMDVLGTVIGYMISLPVLFGIWRMIPNQMVSDGQTRSDHIAKSEGRTLLTTRSAGCSCGQLSLIVEGEPVRISMCHCLDCQRRTGSVFGAQAWFPREMVRSNGDSSRYRRTADSGNKITYHFCPSCGATVYYELDDWNEATAVPIGAFADSCFPAPKVSVYETRKHDWVATPPGVEHFD